MRFIIFFLPVIAAWTPTSWRNKIAVQQPVYQNKQKLEEVENKLRNCAPLIFAGECRELQQQLAKVSVGKGFLLIGGECAESINDINTSKLRDTFRLILQMSFILTYGSSVPVIKMYRGAGQYAKPRSNDFEEKNGLKLPSYRGDIINSIDFNEESRIAKPDNMINAYNHATQILNILRAFSSGGYADVKRIHQWNLDFVKNSNIGKKYVDLANKVDDALKFVEAMGVDINSPIFEKTTIYPCHECLLLPYEEAFVRLDSTKNLYYDCSGAMLWIGERTRQLDGAHIEFIRGINNPIGIKISDKCQPDELIELLNIVNPKNELGKVILITRMGSTKLKEHLPKLITAVKEHEKFVVWCTDPVHGNTITTPDGIKTRSFEKIKEEIKTFFEVHKQMGTWAGGIHLEMTGEDVTECLGGSQNITNEDLSKNYLTLCDPRLNGFQSLELAFLITDYMKN